MMKGSTYVVLMGGLHIEMALLNVLGNWLDGSGWVAIMATANVTTEGRADALQSGSHVSKAQWAHQVTAAALFHLQNQAYTAYKMLQKQRNRKLSHLMIGVQIWILIIRSFYIGAKPSNWRSSSFSSCEHSEKATY